MAAITILCHGSAENEALRAMLLDNAHAVDRIEFVPEEQAVESLCDLTRVRGDRILVLVDACCKLVPGWLDGLLRGFENAPNVGAVTLAASADEVPLCCDARCTALALRAFPAHVAIDRTSSSVHGAAGDFTMRGIACGAFSRAVPAGASQLPAPPADEWFEREHGVRLERAVSSGEGLEARFRSALQIAPRLVSIVMLSWNALEFTKMALQSIREHTSGVPYEVIVVDNGSEPETVTWLRSLQDVRVIYNAQNRGYAGGNNQALAAARGDYVVLLNNDVIVTDGWLTDLLAPFARIPGLGVSAPRSNRVAGDQLVADAAYANVQEMHALAAGRRRTFRGQGYLTDRAIGLCLCVDRRVIAEVGGFDEQYGAGNFEDDDFCLRVRAAGYKIFVCNDVFIHHFGSQTFAANKVDWSATMQANWKRFARKWGYPEAFPENGYAPAAAIARGFDRERHFVPLEALKNGRLPADIPRE